MKSNREKKERCNNCLIIKQRKDMKHVQNGFSVIWKCKIPCVKRKL